MTQYSNFFIFATFAGLPYNRGGGKQMASKKLNILAVAAAAGLILLVAYVAVHNTWIVKKQITRAR